MKAYKNNTKNFMVLYSWSNHWSIVFWFCCWKIIFKLFRTCCLSF